MCSCRHAHDSPWQSLFLAIKHKGLDSDFKFPGTLLIPWGWCCQFWPKPSRQPPKDRPSELPPLALSGGEEEETLNRKLLAVCQRAWPAPKPSCQILPAPKCKLGVLACRIVTALVHTVCFVPGGGQTSSIDSKYIAFLSELYLIW